MLVGSTRAAFFAEVQLAGNRASVGVLNFSATSDNDFSPEEIFPEDPDAIERTIILENIGTLDLKYRVAAQNFSGDDALCQNLQIKINGGDFSPLENFVSPASTLESGAGAVVSLVAELTDSEIAKKGKICLFDLKITGWQTNLDNPEDGGFVAQTTIPSRIKTSEWVVINELMWMGSFNKSDDEWIELRNLSSFEVDISDWKLTKRSGGVEVSMLEIPADSAIPAGGFFTISRLPQGNSAIKVAPDLIDANVDLADRDLQIKLYDAQGVLIDTADDGNGRPSAGFKGPLGLLRFSMERNDEPGDGASASSWHTCWDDSEEMRGYWKTMPLPLIGSLNRGTPTVRNLSDYDEAAERAKYTALEEEWMELQIMAVSGADDSEINDDSDDVQIDIADEGGNEVDKNLEETASIIAGGGGSQSQEEQNNLEYEVVSDDENSEESTSDDMIEGDGGDVNEAIVEDVAEGDGSESGDEESREDGENEEDIADGKNDESFEDQAIREEQLFDIEVSVVANENGGGDGGTSDPGSGEGGGSDVADSGDARGDALSVSEGSGE